MFFSVKQSAQAMEICRRPKTGSSNVYDNLSHNSTLMTNFLPSTTGNMTLTFNNNLNSLSSQVGACSSHYQYTD